MDGKAKNADVLGTWQLMSAHENGQCQLWDISGAAEGGTLHPVAVLGTEGAPARLGHPSHACVGTACMHRLPSITHLPMNPYAPGKDTSP